MSAEMTTHRLFAGPVNSTYRPSVDHVLGAWCLVEDMRLVHGGPDAYPSEPFTDPEQVVSDFDMICALANTLLEEISSELNAQHKVAYQACFWRIVLMPSLIDVLSLAWYRYREIVSFLEAHKRKSIEVLTSSPEREIELHDYRDVFVATHGNPSFSGWMAAVILDELKKTGTGDFSISEIFDGDECISNPRSAVATKTKLQKFRDLFRSRYFSIGTVANEFSLGLKLRSITTELLLTAVIRLKPKRKDEQWPGPREYNGPPAPSVFASVARRVAKQSLPLMLTSHFEEFDRLARGRRYKPGSLRVLTCDFLFDAPSAFDVAHAVSAGETLIGTQHGASTGVMAAMQLSPETEFRFHRYITWGWSSHPQYQGHFLPLPSPQLSELSRARRAPTKDIIFVSSCVRLLAGRMSFEGDIYNRNFAYQQKLEFFQALPTQIKQIIRYRPYPRQPASIPDAELIKETQPEIPHVTGNFHKELMRSRAIVMDSPGSTFYQAMAANVPVVAYWSEDAFLMTDEAKQVYDKFRSLGVIHKSGLDAAEQMARVHHDIEGWWHQPDIQKVREELCGRYARINKYWWFDWMKALWRL